MRFAAELGKIGTDLAWMRQELAYLDVSDLGGSMPARARNDAAKAFMYVCLAALVERVVRDALRQTVRELSGLALPQSALRTSLFSLLCDAELQSIADRRKQTTWSTRVGMLSRLVASDVAVFSEDILPLDGRTIREDHLEAIWLVLGLAGKAIPGIQHELALRDLANGRNEVAHGHSDPVTFGRTKTVSDLQKLVERVEQVLLHLLAALDTYLGSGAYKR